MGITSFYYLFLVAIGAIIYYILPKKIRWIQLLLLSIVFYCAAAKPITFLYILGSAITAYIATNVGMKKDGADGKNKIRIALMAIAIVVNLLVWFVIKADSILVDAFGVFRKVIHVLPEFNGWEFVGALGMGYYTLQVVGYILDCAWGNIEPQKNFFKLLLFVGFFPQLTTGPISRYSQLSTLFEEHPLDYKNITFGAQRILWGFFKKLVIAERAGIIVNAIWADLATYNGFYHWIVLLMYPIQMYTDFSGCTDIVLGTAEIFGIVMPENFNNPFFSRDSKEFWKRWHITLGVWAQDYVLYPVLKSSFMVKFGKFAKKKFGKNTGKFLATSLGMLCLWLVMGIWHGATKFIVGVSLWYWIVLMIGDLISPISTKLLKKFSVNTDNFSWHLFQSMRTYVIYAVGAAFFRAENFKQALSLLGSLITMFIGNIKEVNPWIFFDDSILNTGVSYVDINILIFGVFALFVVGILREKYGYARNYIAKQGIVLRWIIWISLFILVLIKGKYGGGYNAADFIYQGF
ncbi:MAG: hypothetical protein MJ107_00470 [Lachnospiraceae bacterium]|nr:hypothetical protein [Lachnospiraceae bacterium]